MKVDTKNMKAIGKITITVYEGGVTEAVFTGDVPPNAVMGSRYAMRMGYYQYIDGLAKKSNARVAEEKRLAVEKVREEARKKAEQSSEKLKKDVDIKLDLDKLKAELEVARAYDVTKISNEELQERKATIKELNEKVEKLEAEQE